MSSVPVVVVGGLHAEVRGEAVRRLLAGTPHSVAVHHDLRGIDHGRVERVVLDAWGVRERAEVRLAHGCVSCTVREDVLPTAEHLAEDARLVVVETWGSVEPRAVAERLSVLAGTHLAGVLVAVDPDGLRDDLSSGDRLSDRALTAAASDERYVAEVLARQIEYASGLVLGPEGDTRLAGTVLAHLGAGTPVTPVGDLLCPSGALSADDLAARVDPASVMLPCDRSSEGVTTVVWRRVRPLHPERLHDTMDDLSACAVRSRGRLWMASRPDAMFSWDCVAGLLAIEDRGPWLAACPEAAWSQATPARRAAAALDWRPALGDRSQVIAFTGPDLDRAALFDRLDGCLLDDEEMLAGSTTWETYADPFAGLV
ncbi:CobW family GTP-binding protein [Spirillospora sp. CA-294931]|uniref:CobW family GTP-binding protein n=1 Tax=Spirillospora sp. CA-294931 TaxID=3240042 RepID=UPI003D9415C3